MKKSFEKYRKQKPKKKRKATNGYALKKSVARNKQECISVNCRQIISGIRQHNDIV